MKTPRVCELLAVFTVIMIRHPDGPAGVDDQDPRLDIGAHISRRLGAAREPPATLTRGAPGQRLLRLKRVHLI